MKTLLSAVVAATLALAAVEADADATPGERKVALTIESTSLANALDTWAQQSGFQIFVQDWEATRKLTVPSLKGTFTARAALEQLLAGTPLTYVWLNERAVSIRRRAPQPVPTTGLDGRRPPAPAPKLGGGGGDAAIAGEDPKEDPAFQRSSESLEEMLVTGTHIRGSGTSASPVLRYSRSEIDRAGLGSVATFIQRLPQNFNGGASEGTVGNIAGGGQSNNAAEGSGVNLRGLSNDASLVLLNGRRLAPGNSSGNFVDISLVPLSALERVEIVTDGASAIYGSDAVAGVLNLVLRDDFEGAETRLRYGSVTEGDSEELQIGQSLGRTWDSGSALVSYEYFDRSRLQASDRSYTAAAPRPFSLLPDQERHAVFLVVNQDLTANSQVFGDGFYARRRAESDLTTPFFAQRNNVEIAAYSATVGSKTRLAEQHQLELSVSGSGSDTNTELSNLLAGNARLAEARTEATIWSLDSKLDGPLWSIPAGTIRYAAGAQYRDESLSSMDVVSGLRFEPERSIWAGFVEFRVPLIGANGAASGNSQLEFSLAARAEHYDDFGSSTNPKFGVMWRPNDDLGLRATFGTSFKAPLLNDLNPVPSQVVAFPEFDPRTGSLANVLIAFGGNSELGPEEATTWTAGFDFHPSALPALRLNATYYDIDFDDRITTAQASGLPIFDALRQEGALGPAIVRRSPSLLEAQGLVASARQFIDVTGSPGGVDLSSLGAIVDSRSLNLASVATSGIDLAVAYRYDVGTAEVELGLDSTYIFEFDNEATFGAPTVEVLNTPYNPIDLKLRGRVLVQWGGLGVAAYLNYTDSYTDNRNGGSAPIDSWTTADLVVSFTPARQGWLGGSELTLSILNVTDEEPPRVAIGSAFSGVFGAINFDGANANPLGRFCSIQLSKRWGGRD